MTRATKVFAAKPISARAPGVSRQGYPAWAGDARDRYVQTLLTNTIGNTYYADEQELLGLTEQVHSDLLTMGDYDFAGKALVYARQKGFMRLQPVYGLARLVKEVNAGEVAKAIFNKVILTPKDLADFMAICKSLHEDKTEGGRRVKTLAGNWLLGLTEYWAIKYGAEKGDGDYSLSDMIRITHPNAQGKKLPLFDYLLAKATDLAELPQIAAFEALKVAKTDEEKAAAIRAGRLPHEVASSFAGKSKAVWQAIAEEMPTFALLRHLRTLEELDLIVPLRERMEKRLLGPDAIRKSKIFPFRLLSAFNKVTTPWVRDLLRQAMNDALANVPALSGRTVVIVDRSGSMASERAHGSGPFLNTATMFGLSLARRADEARVFLYDDQVEEFAFSRVDSILSQALSIHERGSTDTALPFRVLLDQQIVADTIVLLTDEQQNLGGPVVDAIERYQVRVNPKVKVFIVDVAPYLEKVTPPDIRGVYYLYGWSDNVLSFITTTATGFHTLVSAIDGGQLQQGDHEKTAD